MWIEEDGRRSRSNGFRIQIRVRDSIWRATNDPREQKKEWNQKDTMIEIWIRDWKGEKEEVSIGCVNDGVAINTECYYFEYLKCVLLLSTGCCLQDIIMKYLM